MVLVLLVPFSQEGISLDTLPESPTLGLRPTIGCRVCERQAHLRCFARLCTTRQSRYPAEWQEGLSLQVVSSQCVVVQHSEQEAGPGFLTRLSRHQASRESGSVS